MLLGFQSLCKFLGFLSQWNAHEECYYAIWEEVAATEIVTTRLKICYHKAASNLAILQLITSSLGELFFKLILFYLTKIKTTKVLPKCLVEENLLIIIISIIRTCSGVTNLMIDDSKKPSSSSGITFFIVFHCVDEYLCSSEI